MNRQSHKNDDYDYVDPTICINRCYNGLIIFLIVSAFTLLIFSNEYHKRNELEIIENLKNSKRIIEIPYELMVPLYEAHKEIFLGNIMHDEYVIFVNTPASNYLIQNFLNTSLKKLIFNMNFINRYQHIKFNKILTQENSLIIEAERTNDIFNYVCVFDIADLKNKKYDQIFFIHNVKNNLNMCPDVNTKMLVILQIQN